MPLTQREIAEHLDLDQSAVSRFLEQVEIDWRDASIDDVRIAYVRKLRAQAAGHRSEDGMDLVRERVLTERIDRELKQYTLDEKKGALINVAQLEPALMQMVGAFRTELVSLADKLKGEIDTLYGIDIDLQILNDHTYAALNHLARYDPGDPGHAGAVSESAGAT